MRCNVVPWHASLVAPASPYERAFREAAMRWLDVRPTARVDYSFLAGFEFDGRRVALLDRQRGIRKPAGMQAALAIRTTYTAPGKTPPYADEIGPSDGLQRYKYRGTNPDHPENVALRRALDLQLPLLWFVGVAPNSYEPIYPVHIVAEERRSHQFALALDEGQRHIDLTLPMTAEMRRYVERTTRARLHQPVFRSQVLSAYRESCAVCSLRHRELLDAAHITGDREAGGDPVVSNGLAMCKIHHAAFDARILGIRPDLSVHIRTDILDEIDGPMLRHGLQEMHNKTLIVVPAQRAARPDVVRLERRYATFLDAS